MSVGTKFGAILRGELGEKIMAIYKANKGAKGFVAFGPFGAVMHADVNKTIKYSNMVEGSGPYKRLLKAIKAA